MKLLKNPWDNLFYDLISSSKESIKITSPYVKENIVSKMISSKKDIVDISLITSFKLMNYYVGASDLEALNKIIISGGNIKNYQKLHSKIYIFDDKIAVISSSNLTNGGLINNFEYGVLIDDENVNNVVNDYNLLTNNEFTGKITLNEINEAKKIISNVPKSEKINLPKIDFENKQNDFEVFTGGIESITKSLTGWKLEVFLCINQIENINFKLEEVNEFIPYLKTKFPDNNNIEAKIRQQLQLLRDIGLIEFKIKGNYMKLWI